MPDLQNDKPNTAALPVLLLVEDDDIDFAIFERAVKRQSLDVQIVRKTDAKQGLEYLQAAAKGSERWPALTVLDLNTPQMSGLDFLDAVRADPDTEQAVVFVFTTSCDRHDIEAAYRRHVAGYVVKQVEQLQLKDFLDLLRGYLQSVQLPRINPTCVA